MGIHEQTYRRFKGTTQGRLGRVFTIFKNEFKRRIRKKWVLVLLILSWAIGVFPILTGAPHYTYFILSFIWLLLFTSIVGGPILAEDFQYNSITLFLSRPLKSFDYFLGKYLTLFCLTSLVSLLPNILISIFVIGTNYGTPLSVQDYYRDAYSLTAIGIVMTFVFTNIGMAFSSITNNYKYASGGIFTFLFFSNILSLALQNLYDDIIYFSIWANFMITFSHWDRIENNTFADFDGNISLAILMFISILCLIIVWLRIRRLEISE